MGNMFKHFKVKTGSSWTVFIITFDVINDFDGKDCIIYFVAAMNEYMPAKS